ncbi:helix-turn-helix domain-containing protein [Ensifer sp. LBL]|uniref:helix-turn-helix domain-containing protein n=1 Tax=Ensifer sp. LBL TaxID=2991056 RepID=UPI003D1BAFD1
MENDWRSRLREMIEADGRSKRAISQAVGFGENYVQQVLKDEKDPSFTRLAKLLSELGPRATVYVISGVLGDPHGQLQSALLAYGIDRDDLPAVFKAIKGFVVEIDDEQSQQDHPRDQSAPASLHRAK